MSPTAVQNAGKVTNFNDVCCISVYLNQFISLVFYIQLILCDNGIFQMVFNTGIYHWVMPLPFRPERRKIKLACWWPNLLSPDSLILAQNAPKMRFVAGLWPDPLGKLAGVAAILWGSLGPNPPLFGSVSVHLYSVPQPSTFYHHAARSMARNEQ